MISCCCEEKMRFMVGEIPNDPTILPHSPPVLASLSGLSDRYNKRQGKCGLLSNALLALVCFVVHILQPAAPVSGWCVPVIKVSPEAPRRLGEALKYYRRPKTAHEAHLYKSAQ